MNRTEIENNEPTRGAETRSSSESLVDRVVGLAPGFRQRSDEGTQLRRLPDGSWKALLESGVLRALQPVRWGGGEAHLGDFLAAVFEVARADGSAGWVAGIVGVHPWQLAFFPLEMQQEVWGDDPSVMHSSSYAPTGNAEQVSGGYRLDGRWSFSTGCDHCRWVILGAITGSVEVDGTQVPDFRSFMLPRSLNSQIVQNRFSPGQTESQPHLSDLRESIRGRRAALYGFLAQGASLRMNGDSIIITPRNVIYVRYLLDNRAIIADLAKEHYGRPIQVAKDTTARRWFEFAHLQTRVARAGVVHGSGIGHPTIGAKWRGWPIDYKDGSSLGVMTGNDSTWLASNRQTYLRA